MPKEAISDVILDVLSLKMGVDVWKYILISLSTIRNLDPFQTGLLLTLEDHITFALCVCTVYTVFVVVVVPRNFRYYLNINNFVAFVKFEQEAYFFG